MNADGNSSSRSNGLGGTAQEKAKITTTDLREHLETLQVVSSIASKVFSLLGEQMVSISSTIPVQRGHETVAELKSRAESQREGLKTAFDRLREHIEEAINSFWARYGKQLEATAQKYIQEKIKERVPVEVDRQLTRYATYVENREANKKDVEGAVKASLARSQNSILHIRYPREPIAWIGDLPDGIGPAITFGGLVNADSPLLFDLAGSLGLSTSQDDDRIDTMNAMMRYLGITWKGLPSRGEILLMSTTTNL